MPSLRDIRRRIRSIRNTAKITKAMELVAASRLRRAQMRVTAARPYADAIRTLVAELGAQAPSAGGALHPLLVQRDVLRRGFPTDDLAAWCSPDSESHAEILRDLETVITCFLVRHGGGWCDPYGRALVFCKPCQLLT